MNVRTRIAPSPTGYMHIGNLRTVMFDYFLARQHGGQFIIRVEDTDQERLIEGALEKLLRTFQTLGIDYDEGPILLADGALGEKGEYGPYTQSKRLDLYRPYAEGLVSKGHAYYCFCSKERLEEMRAAQTAAKQTPKYDRTCLRLSVEEIEQKKSAGEQFVIRMKIPEGKATFVDGIRGEITFDNADVDDQVLLKSDGFPTYHLAVVVDDHLMNITHVLRGEEWIPSTPKQIILHDMLGWQMPVYAHVPLIQNPDRTKLSKRKGDVSVESYLSKGYLPEALINFISTLGFNPKSDQEIYTREELTQLFDLSKVNSAGAIMNIEKLDWMNHEYLMKLDEYALVAAAQPFVEVDLAMPTMRRALIIERSRVHRLTEFTERLEMYRSNRTYDPAILVWKKSNKEAAIKMLQNLNEFLPTIPAAAFENVALLEEAILGYISAQGLAKGDVLWPLRVALSGAEQSASPFELLWALGAEESQKRVSEAQQILAS